MYPPRDVRTRPIFSAAFVAASWSSVALAQQSPIPDSIQLGGWTFKPTVDVRIRGEYRQSPIDVGGAAYGSTAVLLDATGSGTPPVTKVSPAVTDQWLAAERIRLGLGVSYGPVSAVVTLQDARVWGTSSADFAGPGSPAPSSFGPWEAYLDVRAKGSVKAFARVGRQRVVWGDGRLVGESDFSPTARSLDAARAGFSVGPVEVEGMAAFLAPPGDLPPNAGASPEVATSGLRTGSQLYGLDATFRIHPLFNVEATGLARFVRLPVPAALTPSDVVVVDGRVFGEHRGFRYAAEGAYQAGRVATFSAEARNLEAFAFAAKAQLETSLWGHLTFSAQGAYASGDNGTGTGTLNRFDPILPEEYANHGPMGLTSWSNLIEAGGDVAIRPLDGLTLIAGYRFDMLADAKGRWTQGAALLPVGADPGNTSQDLGHEIDVRARIVGWDVLNVDLGYGLFLFGEGARNILEAAGRGRPEMQHWGWVQARVRM